jgi:DNA-directed RNA polymerase subunit RPC12/RpoP
MRSDSDRHTERIPAEEIGVIGYGDLAIGGCRLSGPAQFHLATRQQEGLGTLSWMGALKGGGERKAALRGGTDQVIVCRRCGSEILLDPANRLAEEFSVRCPKCGSREFHQRSEVRSPTAG